MTVSASTPIQSYVGNGVTTTFAFGFKILQASDLRVLVNGAVVTNYTVTGVGSPSGGSITFTSAPANLATVIIRRAMPIVRGTDFQALGALAANTLNDDQDAPVLMIQQLSEQLNRSITAPESDIALTQLPIASARANLLLSFDSNGQPTVAAPVAGSASALATQLASSAGAAGVGFLQSGTGAVARTAQSKLRERISVFDFMSESQIADVTGGTASIDVRGAIANAVVAARGKVLVFPKGQYRIDTAGGAITLEEVTLLGEDVLDGATATIDQGAVFNIIGTANSLFTIRRGTTIDGLGFFYPAQIDSASPTVFAPTLVFDTAVSDVQFVFICNNVVYNAYRFLVMNHPTGGIGHIWIENNTICGIHRSIEIGWNLEVIKIRGNSFTFGHWLAATEAGTRAYMRANARAVLYQRGDGIFFTDNMLFGQLAGITMDANLLCQLCRIDSNTFDQVRYGIAVSGTGKFTLSQITDNDFYAINTQNTALEGVGIYLANSGTGTDRLVIVGNTFAQSSSDSIQVAGTQVRRLVVSGNSFAGIASGRSSGGYAAVQLNAANTDMIFVGNEVEGQSNAFANGIICTNMRRLRVHSSEFDACNTAVSVAAAGSVVMTGNGSSNTVAVAADSLSGVTGRIHQTGNLWDKASGSDGKPAVLARKNASQTFNSGTATDVTFATETYDKGNDFGSPTFTAPVALGRRRYRFTISLLHDNTVTVADRWQFLLTTTSGTLAFSYRVLAADFNSACFSGEIELNGGDTAKWQVQRVAGAGNFVTFNDSNANFMTVTMVE